MSHLLDGAQCRGSPSSLYMIFEIRPIIKLIYRLALEGHGCPKIASILTEKGFILQIIISELKAILGLLDLKIKVGLM